MSPARTSPSTHDHDTEPLPEPEALGPRSENDDIFDLIPTRPLEDGESESPDEPPQLGRVEGRHVHPIGITDLGRLSIDNDGRLYWDGKPVEVQRRILMSRRQIAAASIIGLFVFIGALGAAVHGSTAAIDWACRMGWTTLSCPASDRGPPPPPDIPA